MEGCRICSGKNNIERNDIVAKKIRERFPIFLNNPDKIYLDNSSTTQKPSSVIDTLNNFYKKHCANSGRGSYEWANKVTKEINETRKKVAEFINASNSDEIVFTSGATMSSNMIAYSWALHNLKNGDEVLVCFSDHKSTVLPWINIKNILLKFGVQIKIISVLIDNEGDYNERDLFAKVNSNTRVVCLTHIHNVFGMDMGIKSIIDTLRNNENITFIVDASQSMGHIEVNVQDLNADFLYFSGHKMFAANGTGVLWINPKLHAEIKPFIVGGNDNIKIENRQLKYNTKKIHELLECGTLDIPSIITLANSVDFIAEIGMKNIESYILEITQYLILELRKIDSVEFLPGAALCGCNIGYGIVSFRIKGISSQDVGFILNDYGIYVRTGNHCMSDKNSIEDSIRVSLHVYNTIEEINRFISVLKEVIGL